MGMPFGATSIIAFGDVQLKPCMGKYIHDETQNIDFQVTHSLSNHWAMYSCMILQINSQQGNDKAYADLLKQAKDGSTY